jgi:hypothetical protein
MTASTSRLRFSVPAPRPLAWALALACWFGYAVLDFAPQVQLVIRLFPVTDWWGIDTDRVLVASKSLLGGHAVYSDPGLLYSPLAVVLGIPATLAPREYALLALALFNAFLAISVTRWLSRGSWLAVLLVLTFLPFINDVALGNFMVPITAAMAVSTFGQTRRRSGIALGIVAAAFAKPLLAPYFIWLVVRRRKTAEGAIATAVLATVLAAAVTGPTAYVDWFHNLVQGTGSIAVWAGNSGVSGYVPSLAVPIAIIVMALTLLVVARAHENRSLAWVLAAGILVSPYAGGYSALSLLLILPMLRPWPRVYALAILNPLATISAALVGFLALLAGPPGAMAPQDARPAGQAAPTTADPLKEADPAPA